MLRKFQKGTERQKRRSLVLTLQLNQFYVGVGFLFSQHLFRRKRRSYGGREKDFRLPRTSDFRLPTSDFRLRLPTSDFGLQTSDFRLQTSDFRLRTSDFGLRTSDFRLQTSDFGLRTSDFRLQTSDFRTTK